jgi:hypothetical protein
VIIRAWRSYTDGKNRNEFTDDVLECLKKRRVTFYGCAPHYVQMLMSGQIRVTFSGYRNSKPWQGNVEFYVELKNNELILADPAVVADICDQCVQSMSAS